MQRLAFKLLMLVEVLLLFDVSVHNNPAYDTI